MSVIVFKLRETGAGEDHFYSSKKFVSAVAAKAIGQIVTLDVDGNVKTVFGFLLA